MEINTSVSQMSDVESYKNRKETASLEALQQSAENTKKLTISVAAPTTRVSLKSWQDAQDYVGFHQHEDGSSSLKYLLDENKKPVDFNSGQLLAYMEYAKLKGFSAEQLQQ